LIEADLFDVSSSFVMETIKQTTALPLDSIQGASEHA
jgi:Lrp/AsnC family transcriptional regulator